MMKALMLGCLLLCFLSLSFQGVAATAPPSCEFCTLVLEAIDRFALLNSTQAATIAYVQSICTYLPQELISEVREDSACPAR